MTTLKEENLFLVSALLEHKKRIGELESERDCFLTQRDFFQRVAAIMEKKHLEAMEGWSLWLTKCELYRDVLENIVDIEERNSRGDALVATITRKVLRENEAPEVQP